MRKNKKKKKKIDLWNMRKSIFSLLISSNNLLVYSVQENLFHVKNVLFHVFYKNWDNKKSNEK